MYFSYIYCIKLTMTRLLILSRKTTKTSYSMQELVELCQDIELVDTYKNVINSTEICDLTEKTIKPSNRGQCNRVVRKESFLISKN